MRLLAEKFSVGETSLKNYFRGVYGQNISTYLREARMKAAAEFLEDTSRPIAKSRSRLAIPIRESLQRYSRSNSACPRWSTGAHRSCPHFRRRFP